MLDGNRPEYCTCKLKSCCSRACSGRNLFMSAPRNLRLGCSTDMRALTHTRKHSQERGGATSEPKAKSARTNIVPPRFPWTLMLSQERTPQAERKHLPDKRRTSCATGGRLPGNSGKRSCVSVHVLCREEAVSFVLRRAPLNTSWAEISWVARKFPG